MENGESGEPRGIVKNAQCILVMTSAKQQLLGKIFSMLSPLIRMALNHFNRPPMQQCSKCNSVDHGTFFDLRQFCNVPNWAQTKISVTRSGGIKKCKMTPKIPSFRPGVSGKR